MLFKPDTTSSFVKGKLKLMIYMICMTGISMFDPCLLNIRRLHPHPRRALPSGGRYLENQLKILNNKTIQERIDYSRSRLEPTIGVIAFRKLDGYHMIDYKR